MTNAVNAPYSGTAIKQRLVKQRTASPDADPSMLSKHADIPSATLKPTPALNTLTELSFYIQLSGFLIPFSLSLSLSLSFVLYVCPYLAARRNREKVGHLDLRQAFQVTAHNTSRPTGDQHRLSMKARRR